MSGSTRRNFLIASGAGAAAVGAAVALPGAATARAVSLPGNAAPLVAHVSDPTSGTISLFVGEHEVIVHDPDLVARLARAAATANTREA